VRRLRLLTVISIFVLISKGDAAFWQQGKTMPLPSARILPPVWHKGDHWSVVMKTQAPVPADLRPAYREHTFRFRVDSVPDDHESTYRINVQELDTPDSEVYSFYYRGGDLSLEKVTRFDDAGAKQETILRGGAGHPFIYYQRRLPIIPDFLVAGPSDTIGHHDFTVGGYHVVQDIAVADGHARIILERLEALGSLRVSMDWNSGDPWWSRIECTENPPPGAPFAGQVVASGYLLEAR